MKIASLIILSLLVLNGTGEATLTEVQFQSPYVFIGNSGYNQEATFSGANLTKFIFYTRDDTGDGLVDTISVTGEGVDQGGQNQWWDFRFSSRGLNENLPEKFYADARRYPFEGTNPGFSAGITGVGLDAEQSFEYSEFNILDFQYDYNSAAGIVPNVPDPHVISFAAEFTVVDTRFPRDNLTGHIYWNYEPTATIPEPATMVLFGAGLVGALLRRRERWRDM